MYKHNSRTFLACHKSPKLLIGMTTCNSTVETSHISTASSGSRPPLILGMEHCEFVKHFLISNITSNLSISTVSPNSTATVTAKFVQFLSTDFGQQDNLKLCSVKFFFLLFCHICFKSNVHQKKWSNLRAPIMRMIKCINGHMLMNRW